MTKREFKLRVKEMVEDIKEGYYGYTELFDEVYGYIEDERSQNNDLFKEIKRLRKVIGKYEKDERKREDES